MAEFECTPKRVKISDTPSPYLSINPEYTETSCLSDELVKGWKCCDAFEKENFLFSVSPFKHCILREFFTETDSVGLLEEEVSHLELTEHNSDLMRFKQSTDLGRLDKPLLRSLMDCFQQQFIQFLSKSTQFDLDTNNISLSFANYSSGDYLLCHDDQLEARKIAFIYYLVSADWSMGHGGRLDLFNSKDLTPFEIEKSIVPSRNSLIFFEVSDTSFHQVSEVLSLNSSRLSLTGWFHSLNGTKQLVPVSLPIPQLIKLVPTDISILEPWINPLYLDTNVQFEIRKKFVSQSEIKLPDFILTEKFLEMSDKLKSSELQWEWNGIWDRERFQRIKSEEKPEILRNFDTLLASDPYAILLSHLTGLMLSENVQELDSNDSETASNTSLSSNSDTTQDTLNIGYGALIKLAKWTPGSYALLDFTDPIVSRTSRLESTLFLAVGSENFKTEGFCSYVACEGAEGELMRIAPLDNCLCVVYLERGTGKFVKYTSLSSMHSYCTFSSLHFEK